MPETNGHQDNESRLDRIEAAMEAMVGEHEMFRAEHKMLLRSQVLLQDSLEKQKERIDEIGGKLDALIDVVDRNSREFHGRPNRLESRN
jgi:tetrahydromethanopterin S-methyltransferase subunit G